MAINLGQQNLNEAHITIAIEHETEIEKTKVNLGLLGRAFGNASHSPNNIAAIVIVLSILGGFIYTGIIASIPIKDQPISTKDLWAILSPFITGGMGFIFGNKSSAQQA